MEETLYGVYNESRERMLTSHGGVGVFDSEEKAEELKKSMGGKFDSHLTVVRIEPREKPHPATA